MKTIVFCTLPLVLCMAAPTRALAQSNARPDYQHQHKQAQKYQKTLIKERKRAEKAQKKQMERDRKNAAKH